MYVDNVLSIVELTLVLIHSIAIACVLANWQSVLQAINMATSMSFLAMDLTVYGLFCIERTMLMILIEQRKQRPALKDLRPARIFQLHLLGYLLRRLTRFGMLDQRNTGLGFF